MSEKKLKDAKGQIVAGEFSKILIRKKNNENIEIGELLVANINNNEKIILQVYDMQYGSQISQQNIELVSGLMLEEGRTEELFDKDIRTYILVSVKPLIAINGNNATLCKTLPGFLSAARQISKEDLGFIKIPKKPLYLGKLRSGSKVLDTDIILDGEKVFSHHLLIPATTGRGKSNLTSVILWKQIEQDYCGVLVLDPHDEYFGRNSIGLKDHPYKKRVVYYTPSNVPVGARTLKINIESIKPSHFIGVMYISDPQSQAMYAYYKQFGKKWIEAIIKEKPLKLNFHEETLNVIKRRIVSILGIDTREDSDNQKIYSTGVFDASSGKTTISDICNELENANTVIIDTSHFAGSIEILIGSLIASEIFLRYKKYKMKGILKDKPVVSVVLEEAPRVLGKEALERGNNIFSTIAREGRKFRVGLTAITQLPSMIQRDILANMNTKIILGIELGSERQAIIDSASQDLSTDSRNIASLDIGEAIITSNFSRFAIPIKIPNFKDIVLKTQNRVNNEKYPGHKDSVDYVKTHFAGVKFR